jgi:non-specific serine/threonine protein kinase
MILRTEWLQTEEWETIIADEAQAIKNSKTKQSKAMRELTAKTKIAMTGTPVENNLTDLWSIFDFSCPGLLGTNSQFKSAIKKMASGGSDGSSDYGSLRSLISPYLIRRKKTDKTVIADLPDKIEMTATSFLTSKQASLYNGEVERLKKSLEGADGIQRKGLVLASLMKFKQICNHPSQYQSNDSYEPKLSGKFTKLAELVETISSRGEKVLVFTQFREMTDIISHFLGDCFGSKGLILHGGTPVKKRQDLVDQFQDPNGPSFFVLSLKAGGTGLNLTEASHVIHFDRWWNPAVENQATDRAFRIGQRRNVVVHKFMCRGTIEEKIDNMIREKQGLSDAMFEGSKEMNLTELSDQDLLDMVRLDINALDDV